MSKYKYLLFDMDGTIANTDPMLIKTMQILYDKYRDGVQTPIEQIYYFSGPPIAGTLAKEFPNQDQEFMYNEFKNLSMSLYPSTVEEYPHCREVLLELKEKGYRLGVVTNKIRSASLLCLDIIHLDDVFEILVGYDDVKIGKPNPEGIYKAMNYFKANDLNEVLYIGDNTMDLLTANNAGVDCALLSGGPRKLPKETNPKIWYKDFLDLRRILLDE